MTCPVALPWCCQSKHGEMRARVQGAGAQVAGMQGAEEQGVGCDGQGAEVEGAGEARGRGMQMRHVGRGAEIAPGAAFAKVRPPCSSLQSPSDLHAAPTAPIPTIMQHKFCHGAHRSGKKSQPWWSTMFPPSAMVSSRASTTCSRVTLVSSDCEVTQRGRPGHGMIQDKDTYR